MRERGRRREGEGGRERERDTVKCTLTLSETESGHNFKDRFLCKVACVGHRVFMARLVLVTPRPLRQEGGW